MQTKFKDIAQYYLGTGLEVRETRLIYPRSEKIVILNSEHIDINSRTYKIKPLLRSLDSLTKPITVKGYNDDKEFIPMEEVCDILNIDHKYKIALLDFIKGLSDLFLTRDATDNLRIDNLRLIDATLLKWHFNVFNLPETEYIKID